MLKKIQLVTIMFTNIFVFSQKSLNDADQYYNQKNYGDALKIYSQYDENDFNTTRLHKLGGAYYGTTNYCKAKQIFEKSIQKFKNSESAVTLGYIFEKGLCGANSDLKKAYENYSLASDLGDLAGKYNLAVFFREGIYVKKDLCKAKNLFYEAYQKGHIGAKISYAVGLTKGYCNVTDNQKAFEILTTVDENDKDFKSSSYYSTLGWLYETGKGGVIDKNKSYNLYKKGCELYGSKYCCDKIE